MNRSKAYLRAVPRSRVGDILGPAEGDDSGDDSGDDGGGNSLSSGGASTWSSGSYTDPSGSGTYSSGGGGNATPVAPSSSPSSSVFGASGVPTWVYVAGAAAVGVGLIALVAHHKKVSRRSNPSYGWRRGACGGLPRKRARR
jgi:hypothetical protein